MKALMAILLIYLSPAGASTSCSNEPVLQVTVNGETSWEAAYEKARLAWTLRGGHK